MKKILLVVFIFLSLSQARASDTLTIRQVFNFNIGDTFDYSYTLISSTNTPYGDSFQRVVITSKYFSADSDTVTYIREQIYPAIYTTDTITYFDLDSNVTTFFVSSPFNFQNDTVSGREINTLTYQGIQDNEAQFGQGLGIVNEITGAYYYGCPPNDYSYGDYHSSLVYYSNGSYQFGQPYYLLDGSPLIHYIPIPEDCAYWNYTQGNIDSTNYFQVRTGNKVYLNSHTYVALILRSVIGNVFSGDSLAGYFRNDSLGHNVYFYTQPGINEQIIYDFTGIDAGQFDYPTYFGTMLDTMSYGGNERTIWNSCALDPMGDQCYAQVISGIGSLYGLFYSSSCNSFSTCSSIAIVPIELTSFCVCGETLYPDTAIGQCSLLTGISNIPNPSTIHLYPNPTSDQLHLSISEMNSSSYQLILTDILGQKVYSSPFTQSESTLDISGLSQGLYTWRILSNSSIIKTGKLIKQ